jgi:hypothetical protein
MMFRYLDRIDELTPEDVAGVGVDRAFERAAERAGEAWNARYKADYRVISHSQRKVYRSGSIRLLNTPAALVAEGSEMSHCVGTYVGMAEAGKCLIYAIRTRSGRSTLELSPQGDVMQHRGRGNSPPPAANTKLVDHWVRRHT